MHRVEPGALVFHKTIKGKKKGRSLGEEEKYIEEKTAELALS